MALTIQERLKDLRVERGLTLEQLAEQTHLSKSALGSYEADEYKDISHYALIELAKFYEVTVTSLDKGTQDAVKKVLNGKHSDFPFNLHILACGPYLCYKAINDFSSVLEAEVSVGLVWYLYLSDTPVSHLDTVWRTTCSRAASSCWENPLALRRVRMVWCSMGSPPYIERVYRKNVVAGKQRL